MTADELTPTECPEHAGQKNLLWVRDALGRVLPEGYMPSEATLTRWIHSGVLASSGKRVTLPVVKIGGRYATTVANVLLFVWAQHQGAKTAEGELVAVPDGDGTLFPPPASRSRAADAAGRELQAMGC